MNVIGLTVLKNATKMGYPWVESILSVLPQCDYFHVSEGYSEDDTWEVLQRLQECYPDKISLSRYEWPKMETGFAIGDATNYALSCVRHLGGKILYVQADELWHPDSVEELVRLMRDEEMDYDGYNIPFLHLEHNCQVIQEGAGYQMAIRAVNNDESITSHRDAWTFEGCQRPLIVLSIPRKLVHCNYCFWDNVPIKKKVQAEELYPDLGHYAYAAEVAEGEWSQEVPDMFLETDSPFIDSLPEVFHPMLGQRKYFVREELLQCE